MICDVFLHKPSELHTTIMISACHHILSDMAKVRDISQTACQLQTNNTLTSVMLNATP